MHHKAVAQVAAFFRRNDLPQGHFHLLRFLDAVHKADLVAQPNAVGVCYDSRLAKHIAHDKVCALAAYAGQGEQLFKGGGHLTTVFIAQHPHTGGDIPRFGVSQPAGLDDGFNVFGFRSSQRSNIGIFGKQVFHHNVHAGIGALGCQTHADQKLPGVVIIQCTAGVWVFFF